MINSIVGTLGLVLAATSLTWQAVMWRLSGGRARAELRIGAIQRVGDAYVTLPVNTPGAAIDILSREGFERKAIFLTVRNIGRLPVVVERSVVRFSRKYRVAQLSLAVGPDLPHALGVGESETWGIELNKIAPIAAVLREGERRRSIKVRVEIELGNSKIILTRQKMVL